MILIGFQFHELVPITSVELTLFICYQWNIPHHLFNVSISTSATYVFPINEVILGNLIVDMNQANCNSLITFIINLNNHTTSRNYIIKFISPTSLVRLYIGEILFRNQTLNNCRCK